VSGKKEQILYTPKELAASQYRLKVWVMSEIGPHYYEDDVEHNSALLIQGSFFYKWMIIF